MTPIDTPTVKPATPAGSRQEKARKITQEIQETLATMKKAFIRVAVLLARMRDKKLYEALGHATLEEYAQARFGFKYASLSAYLRVHDWLRETKPDLLLPGANCAIADLSDAEDMIWMEDELKRKDLTPAKRTSLVTLQQKAATGGLRRSDLRNYRRQGAQGLDARRAFLAKLRKLRRSGAELTDMPSDVIPHLDAAIASLKNALGNDVAKAPLAGPKG